MKKNIINIKINKNNNLTTKKLINILKKYYKKYNITNASKILIIGLGNKNIICDSLGYEITKIIKKQNKASRIITYSPGVKYYNKISTNSKIKNKIKKINPDLLIIIDSLSTKNIKKLNNIIEIQNKSITPGSGINNNQPKLNKHSLKKNLIIIGVPLVYKNKETIYILKNKKTITKISKIISKAIISSLY